MKFHPLFPFFVPFAQQFRWHSIGQPEGDEIGCASLFPMGEMARVILACAVTRSRQRPDVRSLARSQRAGSPLARQARSLTLSVQPETAVFLNNLLNIPQKPPVNFC